jgi:hypothetical protein
MERPGYEKRYRFVKIAGEFIHFTQFTWAGDDTGFFAIDGPDEVATFRLYAYEGSQGWREASDKLHELGYEELGSLKANGIIPNGWYPPETGSGCGRVKLTDLAEYD